MFGEKKIWVNIFTKANDSKHVQQIGEMFTQIIVELLFPLGLFTLAKKFISVFDIALVERTFVITTMK